MIVTEDAALRNVPPPAVTPEDPAPAPAEPPRLPDPSLLSLTIGALGIVYGDIGTSPLYALRAAFAPAYGLPVTPANVVGILSLFCWSLLSVVSLKYLLFVIRADNRGEGGLLALTALVIPVGGAPRKSRRWLLILVGLFGTALLYADGMITPAISVLAAVEGLAVATPWFEPYILPLAVAILIGLFWVQQRGTAAVGTVFGPVTLVWFGILACLGVPWIVRQPEILAALNPWHALTFLWYNGWHSFWVLGAVFLVVTGGDALYAALGHFGRRPLRRAWFAMVLPALVLNYLGQGALLLAEPEAVTSPFYRMVPAWALYPVVVLATVATVIAAQALITGAFSLTMQAVQMGYLPRLRIEHTSAQARGQVYLPAVNRILMIACVAFVLTFRSSANLAAAYGVAGTTTMLITTILLYRVARTSWHWSRPRTTLVVAFFLSVDLAFWGASLVKLPTGGWVPLVIGGIIFTLLTTWKRGRAILHERLTAGTIPFRAFVEQMDSASITRVPGTAVFMSSDPTGTPPALVRILKHNKVLHDTVILLAIHSEDRPHVLPHQRVETHTVAPGFYQVILHYGFMETPTVPQDLARLSWAVPALNLAEATYFLGREQLLPNAHAGMPVWRDNLFALMSRNADGATDYFRLPVRQVVEVGARVTL